MISLKMDCVTKTSYKVISLQIRLFFNDHTENEMKTEVICVVRGRVIASSTAIY